MCMAGGSFSFTAGSGGAIFRVRETALARGPDRVQVDAAR